MTIMLKKFEDVAATEKNTFPDIWNTLTQRERPIKPREDDPRSEFLRDYNRLLHSQAYRRLKHKTQVFFAPDNDHICTRIEHVNHVTSVSHTIASKLGLNTELTNAIAIGHDIGHPPFGHEGEEILGQLSVEHQLDKFWHEKNSLWFADRIETTPNENDEQENLGLTYAVRDGLICHCGEEDETVIRPRTDYNIILDSIKERNKYPPCTWEGCVVKVADKIAFYGRDLEDAIRLDILTYKQFEKRLMELFPNFTYSKLHTESNKINNTVLIHSFVLDLTSVSDPSTGLAFSPWYFDFIKTLRKVCEELIYDYSRLNYSKERAHLVITSIYKMLISVYQANLTIDSIRKNLSNLHQPLLEKRFGNWLNKYSTSAPDNPKYINEKIYDISNKNSYTGAVIDFIAAMTDNFALRVFDEITSFD